MISNSVFSEQKLRRGGIYNGINSLEIKVPYTISFDLYLESKPTTDSGVLQHGINGELRPLLYIVANTSIMHVQVDRVGKRGLVHTTNLLFSCEFKFA